MRKQKEVAASFTARVLMSLIVDVQATRENMERIWAQVEAMAKEEGVHIPDWDED